MTIRYNRRKICNITYTRKNICILIIGIIIFYSILISCLYNSYQINGIIKNTKPEDVWEYVADFSKMKLLNPTILDFKIISDAGTYDHWRYSVIYKERLSHWPHWLNEAQGDYAVKKILADNGKNAYVVSSKHKTCFFAGAYCLRSESEFYFIAEGTDTFCTEKVSYQCPAFLSVLCKREVEYQRRAIIHNLTIHFQK